MTTINSSGLHSLATLIKRLEAAASRFEDIAELPLVLDSKAGGRPAAAKAPTDAGSSTYIPPVPGVPSTLAASVPAQAPSETAKSVAAFKTNVIDAKIKPFVALSKELGAQCITDTVGLVEKQYDILYSFLQMASACQKPDQSTLESLLKPFQSAIEAVSRAPEVHRRERDWGTHLTLLANGAPVIGWVVSPKPAQTVTDLKDTVMYYGNRIKSQFKDKDPKHAEWVNAFIGTIDTMHAYIKEFYLPGFTWNPKGIPASEYQPSSGGGSGGAPPAPPPPPPPPATTAAPAAASGGPAAVFAQLNRGEDVTKGLRKVDKSEMTHKNPSLRPSGVVPASTSPSPSPAKKPTKPTKPQALAGKKPAKFALEGNKWVIEFQEQETITVENAEINHAVNIFGCKNTTVVIKGKVNTVNIINSTKTSVLIQSVIASVSVTASPSFTIQILGSAPMVQLDSTDSGQIYLSKDSLNTEITTAKCSAINVSLPVEGEEEGIFEEQPIPEMLKTTIRDGLLVTTIVEHTG